MFNIYLGVEPWLVGLALTLIRLYDAVADPVVGWISDNIRSRHGRRRPFILIAGILSGIGLPMLFMVSPSWVEYEFLGLSVVFWYMVLSSLIFIPVISAFSIPYNSLSNELTPDYDERTSIMTYRKALQKCLNWQIFMPCVSPIFPGIFILHEYLGCKPLLQGLWVCRQQVFGCCTVPLAPILLITMSLIPGIGAKAHLRLVPYIS